MPIVIGKVESIAQVARQIATDRAQGKSEYSCTHSPSITQGRMEAGRQAFSHTISRREQRLGSDSLPLVRRQARMVGYLEPESGSAQFALTDRTSLPCTQFG